MSNFKAQNLIAWGLIFVFLLGFLPAFAGEPFARVQYKNIKFTGSEKKQINNQWNALIAENKKVLLKPGKKYTTDQFCSFKGSFADGEKIDFGKLVLDKHKENFDYNIMALDFLQSLKEQNITLKAKNPKKEVEFRFKYFSF